MEQMFDLLRQTCYTKTHLFLEELIISSTVRDRGYKMKRIAVLVPCYNEELTIANVIEDFHQHLPEADIYVYDNNSSDQTARVALEHGTTVSAVERAIRHAITAAWNNGGLRGIKGDPCTALLTFRRKPTNKGCITAFADMIRLVYGTTIGL